MYVHPSSLKHENNCLDTFYFCWVYKYIYHIRDYILGDNLNSAYVPFGYQPGKSCNLNREMLSCPVVTFARHISVT